MSAYIFKGKAKAALTYESPGVVAIQEQINVPDLIAHPDQLALASAPDAGLTAFAGFVQNDTLKIPVPAGFLAQSFVVKVIGTQATTIDIGDSGTAALFVSNGSLASAVAVMGSFSPKLYLVDDYIIVLVDQAATLTTANFVVALDGSLVK